MVELLRAGRDGLWLNYGRDGLWLNYCELEGMVYG